MCVPYRLFHGGGDVVYRRRQGRRDRQADRGLADRHHRRYVKRQQAPRCHANVYAATISNIVCYTLWPQSATTRLQNQISTTIDSFATLFRLLQASFLLDRPPNDASYASLQAAAKAHSAAFTQLKADLAEAQEERLVDGRIGFEQRQRYAAVTASLTRLAQHLTGMRGGTGLQGELLRGKAAGRESDTGSESSGSDSDDEKDLAEAGNLFWSFRDQVADELRQLTVSRFGRLAGSPRVLIALSRNSPAKSCTTSRSP